MYVRESIFLFEKKNSIQVFFACFVAHLILQYDWLLLDFVSKICFLCLLYEMAWNGTNNDEILFRCSLMSIQHFYEFVVIGVTWNTHTNAHILHSQYIHVKNFIIIYWRAHTQRHTLTNASQRVLCISL